METQTTWQVSPFEKTVLKTIRTLPDERARQVLDFARWLQTQPDLSEEISEEELEAEESAWEEVYLTNQESFRAMAQQALGDLKTGNTLEMVIDKGKVTTR